MPFASHLGSVLGQTKSAISIILLQCRNCHRYVHTIQTTRKQLLSRTGVMAIKKGMSAVWDADGNRIPVTILQISRAQVTAVKTPSKDGYWAVQVGIGYRKPENVTKAMLGHFAAARVAPKVKVGEFRVKDESGVLPVGSEITVDHFYEGQYVDVRGTGKGKGFAGVMKRHGFHGLPASHGVSISHRSVGSTGASQDPGRVLPGKRMAGHMGGKNVTTRNMKVVKIDQALGLLLVKGAVPGPAKGVVYVKDALMKPQTAKVNPAT